MAIEEKPVDTEQTTDRKPESEYNFVISFNIPESICCAF